MDLKEALLTRNASLRHPWEHARAHVIRALIRSALPDWTNCKGAVLEVGCGDAYILRILADAMPHALLVGVDTALTDDLIRKYSAGAPAGRFTLYSTMASALEQCAREIDCVLLLDVLEHVSDENDIIAPLRACRLTSNWTRFIITVPAFDFLFSRHDRFLGHFRRYSRKSLDNRLTGCGLRTCRKGYFFFSLFILRCIQVSLEKNFGRETARESRGIGDWKPIPLFDEIVVLCLRLDFLISWILRKCGILLPGLSVYAQCLKQSS